MISERQRPLGLEFRVLDRKACLALVPALAPRIDLLAGGIHFEGEEGGDLLQVLRTSRRLGATGAADFARPTIEPWRSTATGSRASAPIRDTLSADAYVLALGADSPLLMRPLGVRLPIIPVKGYSITVPRAPFPDAPAIPVVDELRKFGMMPLPGRLRLSGLAEIAGYDTVPDERRFAAFVAGFTGLFPQLRKCSGCRRRPQTLRGEAFNDLVEISNAASSQKVSLGSGGDDRLRRGDELAFGERLQPGEHVLMAGEGAAGVRLGKAVADDLNLQPVRGEGASIRVAAISASLFRLRAATSLRRCARLVGERYVEGGRAHPGSMLRFRTPS